MLRDNLFSISHESHVVPNETLKLKDVRWDDDNRLCFRGDSRGPEVIFYEGFLPREPMFDNDLLIESPFQSQMRKLVAYTSRFAAAMLFPFDEEVSATWVYVFKARKGFNVHQHGCERSVYEPTNNVLSIGMFLNEHVTLRIPPEDIVGAVKVIRCKVDPFLSGHYFEDNHINHAYHQHNSLMTFYEKRGTYLLNDYRCNSACALPDEEINLANSFIEAETKVAANGFLYIPRPSSGYHQNFFYNKRKQLVQSEKKEQEQLGTYRP